MPRARRPENARVSAVAPGAAMRRAVCRRGPRLGAEHERGAGLRGGGAGGEHGGHGGARRDRAGRDERHVDGGADERQQRQQRDVGRPVVERAAVAAGLDALNDERVGARRDRRRASSGWVTVTQAAAPVAWTAATAFRGGQPRT